MLWHYMTRLTRGNKSAFVLAQTEGADQQFDEFLLAEDDAELNDWMAKLNYASTLTTAKVGVRSVAMLSQDKRWSVQPSVDAASISSLATPAPAPSLNQVSEDGNVDDHLFGQEASEARLRALRDNIAATEESIPVALAKVEDYIKTARHLQILAPCTAKTRNDLLAAGARLAYKLKWARYEVWRLRCYWDVLTRELEAETTTPSRRLNSRSSIAPASSLAADSEVARVSSRASFAQRETGSFDEIDKAFATPSDVLDQAESVAGGAFKLPPLALDRPSSRSDIAIRSASPTDSSVARPPSMASMMSHSERLSVIDRPIASPTPTPSVRDQESAPNSGKASIDFCHCGCAPTQHHRGRKGRDSASTVGIDDSVSLSHNTDGLHRKEGSFTVHGKQASVITLGPEWQKMSVEDRLKARQTAQMDEARHTSEDGLANVSDVESFFSIEQDHDDARPGTGRLRVSMESAGEGTDSTVQNSTGNLRQVHEPKVKEMEDVMGLHDARQPHVLELDESAD
ncbi:hypothetical protein MRB53_039237 [Persea americana]|nr:hypothetical protein MRB53_039237 [Persea americana]